MQRFLIASGLILFALGLLYPVLTKLGLGSLPGDINVKGERWTVHFPVVTCIVLSILLSVGFWLWGKFR